jgi:flavin reductase (DIM6/NTAB) family NADH-FMN oxidoreductase RutF/rubredoxin
VAKQLSPCILRFQRENIFRVTLTRKTNIQDYVILEGDVLLMALNGLYKISYGVYVVTSGKEGRCNGQIANTVVQVSSQPATVAVSINKQNFTHEFIKQSGVFAVSVLSKDAPLSFIGNFGFKCGREFDKFAGMTYIVGETGTRIVLNHAVAYFEAKVVNEIDVKTHTVFVGEIVAAKLLNDETPMTYDFYHQIKRGTTPKSAPTFIQAETKEEIKDNSKYVCRVCGYVYDPILGDPDSGIQPGTSFEKLPENWVCPICKAAKIQFDRKN